MLKRIHINRPKLLSNRKYGRDDPILTCKTSKSNEKGYRVDILDDNGKTVATIIHSNKPLSCGAVSWVETRNKVKVHKRRNKIPKKNKV